MSELERFRDHWRAMAATSSAKAKATETRRSPADQRHAIYARDAERWTELADEIEALVNETSEEAS